jgi:stearoyl-CoA desaturase (delta-9 desaturase)
LPDALTQRYPGPLSAQLDMLCSMGRELSTLWEAKTATREQLLRELQDWCHRAEASEILPLQQFSRELRRYG